MPKKVSSEISQQLVIDCTAALTSGEVLTRKDLNVVIERGGLNPKGFSVERLERGILKASQDQNGSIQSGRVGLRKVLFDRKSFEDRGGITEVARLVRDKTS